MGITGYRRRQLWSGRNDGSRNEVDDGRGVDTLGKQRLPVWEARAGRMDGSIGRIVGKRFRNSQGSSWLLKRGP